MTLAQYCRRFKSLPEAGGVIDQDPYLLDMTIEAEDVAILQGLKAAELARISRQNMDYRTKIVNAARDWYDGQN